MKKKKNILALPDKNIGFKELCDVRATEMIGVLPGFATKVKMGDKEAWINSPGTFNRTLFSLKED